MITIRNRRPGLGAAVLALGSLIAVLSSALPSAARAEGSVSVLCYHSFLEKKKMDPYSFTIDELNSQIMQLKKEGFRFVSVNDIVSGRITGSKNVLVTIDDGNKSVYEAHRKVFRPNGIRPLLGIYPNIIINKKHYALTWEQLQELADNGCDIAAHGYFHLKVNRKLHDKNPSYFKKEIYLVKKILEEKLNRKVVVYVYPFGLRDDLTIKTLREAGYRYAFTINNGRIDLPLGAGDRSFELPRYMVTRTGWKYCFNSVVRNGRSRLSYRVASAGGESVNKADMTAMERSRAERHDPAAELTARITDRMNRTAMADIKTGKKEKLARNSGTKKKIEKKTGIDPDITAWSEENDILEDEVPVRTKSRLLAKRDDPGIPDIFPPVSREKDPVPAERKSQKKEKTARSVENGLERGTSATDRSDFFPLKNRHASLVSIDGPSSGGQETAAPDAGVRREGEGSVEAGVAKVANPSVSRMKDQYNGINSRSLRTYRGVLGMVSGKMERIKHAIRKYVLNHF